MLFTQWKFTVLVAFQCTIHFHIISGNLYDPHVTPKEGPYFEGWYWRLVDHSKEHSFGLLYGYVVPEDPEEASNLAYVGTLQLKPKVLEFDQYHMNSYNSMRKKTGVI